ncbi:MAG TPA: hypothetical protein VJS12_26405 [Steroidobacteraceae bacterium]|nr:hypothetical protein [Steroidobacteraceae bacterium]
MNRVAICLSIAGIALAACGSKPDSAAKSPQASARAAAPDDPLARMARAVGNGKPGAAVEIRYEFSGKPAVGSPIEAQIAFIPHAGVDSMEIVIKGMDGVTLTGAQSANFTEVEPQKPYVHTLTVQPERSGVFYLSVVVTTQIGNQNLSRTFSVPFVVGNVPAQQKPAPQTDGSGEPVQPAKAQETTRPG